jgi:hypothetical protein
MTKIKIITLSLLVFAHLVWAYEVCAEELPLKNLPTAGKSLADFLPRGWTVGDQASGDLNGDGVSDIAAILVKGNPAGKQSEAEDEFDRVLIALLGHDKGKFTLAGRNDGLLLCKGCGGVKEGVGISIKKGVIVVQQWSGSREFTDETWRFRYDPKAQRFVIIGRDIETGDGMLGTGTIVSFNYLTGKKITKNYRYDKKGENKITTSTKKENGPRKSPFIEDVRPAY